MKTIRLVFVLVSLACNSGEIKAQHVIKNSLYYNSILQDASSSYSIYQNIIYELGYEQFINDRVSLSLTGHSSLGYSQTYSGYGVTYGPVRGLNYEVKYFFNPGDGLYNDGGYLASALSWRYIKESVDVPFGAVMNAKIICIPYNIKIGHRAVYDSGLFIDYFTGLGINLFTKTEKKTYSGSPSVSFAKPSPLPFTIGFTMGYVF
ncbi:MAG: hypothetical protein K1X81_02070 [Bacteroidia bacterium]|nr:hypothetical protein [Bacteroidia bacterium]